MNWIYQLNHYDYQSRDESANDTQFSEETIWHYEIKFLFSTLEIKYKFAYEVDVVANMVLLACDILKGKENDARFLSLSKLQTSLKSVSIAWDLNPILYPLHFIDHLPSSVFLFCLLQFRQVQ